MPDLLAARAAADPDKLFVLFEEEPVDARARGREAWRAGNGLQRLGVEIGDYISSWMPTGPDVLRTWFGANAAGAVYAPLNLAARGTYLEHTLNLAEAKVLVAHHRARRAAAGPGPAAPRAGRRRRRARARRAAVADVTMDELLDGVSDERPELPRPVEPWDDLSLIYTSGTTGPSKGVRAAYAAFWNYANCFVLPFVNEDDRYLSSLPMFHTAGTGITYSMLRAGGSMALNKGFSASTFWDDVRRFEATVTIAIHGMVTFMLDQPESPTTPTTRCASSTWGRCRSTRSSRAATAAGLHAYGMTEVPVPIVSGLDPDDGKSCGRAADPVHYELRLVDENDVPVPPGTPGELVARHTLPWTINSGYKNMPEATAEAWRNGWFHTGDQFTQDEDGNFYFLDRIKDVIRRRGENISSFEVEAEVLSHPLVKDAAAVAVRNPDLDEAAGDEEVKVVVVLEEGAALDPAELVEYLAARMPAYWVPRFVEFVRSCRAPSRTS